MVCLQLGSNMGDREKMLKGAILVLEEKLEVVQKGAIYVTEAWGNTAQDDFYNQLILVDTLYSPYELLKFTQGVEERLGRERDVKWGPRIIDIDIIYYDEKVIYSPVLKIPHEFMHLRRFILEPLNDMKTNWIHPIIGDNVIGLLEKCIDKSEVKRLKN